VQREKDRGRQEDDEPSKAIWKISNEKTPKDNAHLNKKLVEEQQPPDSPAQGIDRRKYRRSRTTREEQRVGGVGTGKGKGTRSVLEPCVRRRQKAGPRRLLSPSIPRACLLPHTLVRPLAWSSATEEFF
jgi:hypothetical protein